MEKHYHMGVNYLVKIIAGKWTATIICALGIKNFRYLELHKYLTQTCQSPISKKVLTEQLNQLEENGILTKQNYGTVPPKVVYSLTKVGNELAKTLVELNFLGEKISNTPVNQQKINFDISAQNVKVQYDELTKLNPDE